MARRSARSRLDVASENGALEVGRKGLHSEWMVGNKCGSETPKKKTAPVERSGPAVLKSSRESGHKRIYLHTVALLDLACSENNKRAYYKGEMNEIATLDWRDPSHIAGRASCCAATLCCTLARLHAIQAEAGPLPPTHQYRSINREEEHKKPQGRPPLRKPLLSLTSTNLSPSLSFHLLRLSLSFAFSVSILKRETRAENGYYALMCSFHSIFSTLQPSRTHRIQREETNADCLESARICRCLSLSLQSLVRSLTRSLTHSHRGRVWRTLLPSSTTTATAAAVTQDPAAAAG